MVRLPVDPGQVGDLIKVLKMSLISRSVDLDIPPDMRLTSQYKATLGHKACHDFAKKNAAFQ